MFQAVAKNKLNLVLGAQVGNDEKEKVINKLATDADAIYICALGEDFSLGALLEKYPFIVFGMNVKLILTNLFTEMYKCEAIGMNNLSERIIISHEARFLLDPYTSRELPATFYLENAAAIVENLRDSPDLSSNEKENFKKILEMLPLYVKNAKEYLKSILRQGKTILAQCADGALLDGAMKSGFSKLDTTCSKRCLLMETEIKPHSLGNVIGVVKAYESRNGSGTFPTEQKNIEGSYLQRVGEEHSYLGNKVSYSRCGWLDLVMIGYSLSVNGCSSICITKLNVLDKFKEVKVGVSYTLNGDENVKMLRVLNASALSEVEVVYETLPGWQESTKEIKTFQDLPENAKKFVRFVETTLNIIVKWISTGSDDSLIECD